MCFFNNYIPKFKNIIDISCFLNYKKTGQLLSKKEYSKYYNFDYMEDSVKKWKVKHITRDMIGGLPFGVCMLVDNTFYDANWEIITDFDEWHEQREHYIDYLYQKYKR